MKPFALKGPATALVVLPGLDQSYFPARFPFCLHREDFGTFGEYLPSVKPPHTSIIRLTLKATFISHGFTMHK
ncbi:hypothetical protein GE061_008132 [Apolygus lucorum]|uniref:Uncharacterized protein n=1 Tax=Apolygus lucorum TaxID=248454 RepID=A0A8S9WQ89_APOLU|nr:hypothetical protein GE061_008132 [Apolygus lucorum]